MNIDWESLIEPTHWAALDVETTGLNPWSAEIVSVGLVWPSGIDSWGGYYSMANPGEDALEHADEALRVNRLEKNQLRDAAPLKTVMGLVGDILQQLQPAYLVAYNAPFDRGFVGAHMPFWRDPNRWRCAMARASSLWGDWSEYHQDYKWLRLVEAITRAGLRWVGEAHHAGYDALNTAVLWRTMDPSLCDWCASPMIEGHDYGGDGLICESCADAVYL